MRPSAFVSSGKTATARTTAGMARIPMARKPASSSAFVVIPYAPHGRRNPKLKSSSARNIAWAERERGARSSTSRPIRV
jgi:hypothetical protein